MGGAFGVKYAGAMVLQVGILLTAQENLASAWWVAETDSTSVDQLEA